MEARIKSHAPRALEAAAASNQKADASTAEPWTSYLNITQLLGIHTYIHMTYILESDVQNLKKNAHLPRPEKDWSSKD